MPDPEVKIRITTQNEASDALDKTEKALQGVADAASDAAKSLDDVSSKGGAVAKDLETLDNVAKALGDDLKDIDAKELKQSLGDAGDAAKVAGDKIQQAGTAAKDAGEKMEKLGTAANQAADKFERFKEVGTVLTSVGKTMGGIGAAITAALGAAANEYGKLETSLINIKHASQLSGEEIITLGETIKNMAASSTVSMADIALGFESVLKAGMSLQDIQAVMEAAVTVMQGFGTSAEETVGLIQLAIRQFGIELSDVGKVADTVAASLVSLSFDDLSSAMSRVGAVAAQAGVSFEEVAALLMLIKERGVPVENTILGLRKLFSELVNPTDAFANSLDRIGISIEEIQDPTTSLGDKLKQLADAGYSTADAMHDFGLRTGTAAAVAISEASGKLNEYITVLNNSGGAAKQAAQDHENSWAGVIAKLKNAFSVLATTVGQAVKPTFDKLIQTATDLAHAFNEIPAPIRDTLTQLGAIAGVVMMAVGGFSALVGGIMKSIENFTKFGKLLTDVILYIPKLAENIAVLITRFMDLAFVAGQKIFEGLVAAANALAASIKATAAEFAGLQGLLKAGFAIGAFVGLAAALAPVIQAVRDARKEIQDMVDAIRDMTGGKVELDTTDMEKFISTLVSLGGLIPGVKDGLDTLFLSNNVIEYNEAVGKNIDLITELAGAFAAYKQGAIDAEEFGKRNEEIQAKIKAVVDEAGSLEAAFGPAYKSVTELSTAIENDLVLAMDKAGRNGKDAADKIIAAFNNIKTNPDLLPKEVVDMFNARLNSLNFKTLEDAAKLASGEISNYFDAMGDEVAAKLGIVDGFEFSTIPAKARDAGRQILSAFVDVGVDTKEALGVINTLNFDGLAVSVDDAKKRIVEALTGIGYSAADAEATVNSIDFEELKRRSAGAEEAVVDAFTQAKNDALAALEEINKQKFDALAANFRQAVNDAVTFAINDIDALDKKLQELDGKDVTITISLQEATT